MNDVSRRRKPLRAITTVALAVVTAVTGLLVAAPAEAAPKQCAAGSPGLAVQVGWQKFTSTDFATPVEWMAVTPHVQVANCDGQIKYVRIRLESYTGGKPVSWSTTAFPVYPKKYGDRSMMVHWPNYLPVEYESKTGGPFAGVSFARVRPADNPTNVTKNQRPYELASCSARVDGIPVDMSDVTFRVLVWPLDSKRKVIPDIAGAVVGPFGCGEIAGTA